MNKLITLGIILIVTAILATAIFFSIGKVSETAEPEIIEEETLEDLSADHLDEALVELDQIDFDILT